MIHIMLPEQYLQRAGTRLVEPRHRLMLAVLMTAVDDCQRSASQAATARRNADRRAVLEALAYVASTDRTWPFSFENLCDAVGLEPETLRRGLQASLERPPAPMNGASPPACPAGRRAGAARA